MEVERSMLKVLSVLVVIISSGKTSGERQLNITAYAALKLYVDGVHKTGDNWNKPDVTSTFSISSYTRVIAVQAVNTNGCSGILASTSDDYILTNSTNWKCTTEPCSNWHQLGFDDSDWPAATGIGSNGNTSSCSDWTLQADVSTDADWIWSSKYQASNDGDLATYCRTNISICDPSGSGAPCQNGGTCSETNPSLCTCSSGYAGELCETNIDECISQPCLNGATCEDVLNGYKCHCTPGFFGTNCADTGCGSILHEVDGVEPAPGWSSLCHITTNDTNYVSTPCNQLLQDIPFYGNASNLLAAGGNFGCWLTTSYVADTSACINNYQQTTTLSVCGPCVMLVVCIRFPA